MHRSRGHLSHHVEYKGVVGLVPVLHREPVRVYAKVDGKDGQPERAESPEFGKAEHISLSDKAVHKVKPDAKTQVHMSVAGPPLARFGEKSTAHGRTDVF